MTRSVKLSRSGRLKESFSSPPQLSTILLNILRKIPFLSQSAPTYAPKKIFHGSFLPEKLDFSSSKEKDGFIEDLRKAMYTTCLAAYVQGMNITDVADKQNKWSINYDNIVKMWRAGFYNPI